MNCRGSPLLWSVDRVFSLSIAVFWPYVLVASRSGLRWQIWSIKAKTKKEKFLISFFSVNSFMIYCTLKWPVNVWKSKIINAKSEAVCWSCLSPSTQQYLALTHIYFFSCKLHQSTEALTLWWWWGYCKVVSCTVVMLGISFSYFVKSKEYHSKKKISYANFLKKRKR